MGWESVADDDEKMHALCLLRKLDRMRKEVKQCDLIIKIDEKELHVHRNVMIAGCDYFDAMFSHENVECSTGTVDMKGVEFGAMEKIVDFLYTGRLSFCERDCVPLLYAASMLQLSPICLRVGEFLQSRLSVQSFFGTKRIAKMFSLVELEKSCDEYAVKRLDTLVKDEEFYQIDAQYLSFLLSTKDSISPGTEDSKMAVLLRWIKADEQNRRKQLIPLLNVLDTTAISHEYGRYLAKNEEICYESGECMKLLYLAATRRVSGTVNEAPASISFSEPNALLIFNERSNFVEAYRPGYNSWQKLHRLRDQWIGRLFTAAVCHEYLYVLMVGKNVFRIVVGDSSNGWEQMDNMREDHGPSMVTATHNESIFIAGNNSLEKLNTETDHWEAIGTTSDTLRDGCEILEFHDFIYVIGGHRSADATRYCVRNMSWSRVQPMNEARCNPSAAAFGGKIIVCGGTDHLGTSVESYDVNCDTWTYIANLNGCRNGLSLCLASRKLFATGSPGNSHPLQIEVYEQEENQWKVLDQRYTAERGVSSCLTVNAFIPW